MGSPPEGPDGLRSGQPHGLNSGKPRWLKVPMPASPEYLALRALLRRERLHTVCESAACPNVGQCWKEGSAAFMILGDLCTRACTFCNVTTGRPAPPDPDEPERLARTARLMGLRHVVITSVTRDDLPDGGAAHFVACMAALRSLETPPAVELLVPDFGGQEVALAQLFAQRPPEVLNHNLETVPRLYPSVRPGAGYQRSLALLARATDWGGAKGCESKSGLMLGLGEEPEEVLPVLEDLRRAGVTLLTLGQYLRPSLQHHPVVRYLEPELFQQWGERARALGFRRVESHPLARSSFHAHILHEG